MNISKIDSKYAQWLNSVPTAKNNAKEYAETLNHRNAVSVETEKDNASQDVNLILYSGEVTKSNMKNYSGTPITECEIVPSSERDYTFEDALNYQYNKQFTIKLDDIINGNVQNIKLREPNSPVPKEFIDSLKQSDSAKVYDSAKSQFYIMGLNEDTSGLEHSIDYLASGYVVSKKHLEDTYSGSERENLLSKLESDFDSAVKIIAENTAKEVGGFFGQNEVRGETQKIQDSVIKAYQDLVNKYSEYISKEKDYAKLDGTDNQWLKNDDSYMACQLRKVAKADKISETAGEGKEYYSLEELQKTKDMVSEIKSYSSNGKREISCYQSEEEIGLKMAELDLKGEVFNKYSDVSDSLKKAVSQSIQNFISTLPDRLNKQLAEERKKVAEPGRMADLDEKQIFSVYHKVMSIYQATKDMLTALKEGAAYGKNQHMNRTKDSQYSFLNRYGNNGSIFWNNFFKNTLKYREDAITPDLSNNGYIDKKSGIETLSENWNSFVSKYTDDKNIQLSTSGFLGYA
ncbi:hypothetical protein [Aminipila terrae]|uniref:Uncharacterized protein n=1 Tax=Aminipila terrae TaxID=2697030 RepID=A0A6P1MIB1_9FIRM|nr:hypothetical protein [Aminipila terrae]QHI72933.1 hypothetical protein Ami3637_11440 [Aminipila terrae]